MLGKRVGLRAGSLFFINANRDEQIGVLLIPEMQKEGRCLKWLSAVEAKVKAKARAEAKKL